MLEIEYNGKNMLGEGSEFYAMMRGVVVASLYKSKLSLQEIEEKFELIKEFEEKWKIAKISELKNKICSLNKQLDRIEKQ